jgi:hypothetical protein
VSIFNDLTKQVGRHKSQVTNHQPREASQRRTGTCVVGKLVAGITPLVIMLLSCRASNIGSQSNWDTYRNPRYGFEFPYPSNWVPFPMPDNRDGQAFRDPQNASSEIRGWAANKLSETVDSQTKKEGHRLNLEPSPSSMPAKDSPKFQEQNFTTEQGVTGKLRVEIGSDTSLMTLTLSQGNVLYNWQGQCNSEQFADYYRFFYYVARQYRLPPLKNQ